MKAIVFIVLLLAGCTTPAELPSAPPERNCPELPRLKVEATTADMRAYIGVIANLYARCAETP